MNSPVNVWTGLTEAWIVVCYFYKSSGSVWFPFLWNCAGGVKWRRVSSSHLWNFLTAAGHQQQAKDTHRRSHTLEVPCRGTLHCHRLTGCPPHLSKCDGSCPLAALTPAIKRAWEWETLIFTSCNTNLDVTPLKVAAYPTYPYGCIPVVGVKQGSSTNS